MNNQELEELHALIRVLKFKKSPFLTWEEYRLIWRHLVNYYDLLLRIAGEWDKVAKSEEKL